MNLDLLPFIGGLPFPEQKQREWMGKKKKGRTWRIRGRFGCTINKFNKKKEIEKCLNFP